MRSRVVVLRLRKADGQHAELLPKPLDAEAECRLALRGELYPVTPQVLRPGAPDLQAEDETRFEVLKRLVERLPPEVNRGDVYTATALGAWTRDAFEMLDPEWTRKRDAAFAKLDDALRAVKVVLAERNLDAEVSVMEGQVRRLVRGAGETHESGPIDWREQTRRKLLRNTRRDMGWSEAGRGRPRADWRTKTLSAYRAAGVADETANELLEIAGLTGKTPDRRPPQPKLSARKSRKKKR